MRPQAGKSPQSQLRQVIFILRNGGLQVCLCTVYVFKVMHLGFDVNYFFFFLLLRLLNRCLICVSVVFKVKHLGFDVNYFFQKTFCCKSYGKSCFGSPSGIRTLRPPD